MTAPDAGSAPTTGHDLDVAADRPLTMAALWDENKRLTRERDDARRRLGNVETLASEFAAFGTTSVYESAVEIAEMIRAALAGGTE